MPRSERRRTGGRGRGDGVRRRHSGPTSPAAPRLPKATTFGYSANRRRGGWSRSSRTRSAAFEACFAGLPVARGRRDGGRAAAADRRGRRRVGRVGAAGGIEGGVAVTGRIGVSRARKAWQAQLALAKDRARAVAKRIRQISTRPETARPPIGRTRRVLVVNFALLVAGDARPHRKRVSCRGDDQRRVPFGAQRPHQLALGRRPTADARPPAAAPAEYPGTSRSGRNPVPAGRRSRSPAAASGSRRARPVASTASSRSMSRRSRSAKRVCSFSTSALTFRDLSTSR